MSKIRKSAKGEDCTLRLISICNGNSETTCLSVDIGKPTAEWVSSALITSAYTPVANKCHDVLEK